MKTERELRNLLEAKADAANVFVAYIKNSDGDSLVLSCDRPDDLIQALKADGAFSHNPSSRFRNEYFRHKESRFTITVVGENKVSIC